MQKRLILCLGGPLDGTKIEFSGIKFNPNELDEDNMYFLERGVDAYGTSLENYIWNGEFSLFENFLNSRFRQM
ncbi:hypothetical protein [Acinetobacter bereziniae]|uniref:hypothetical protein n=1 Tax=Acinetobacter bereziniae TaxID=106648 RepID=UPI00125EDF13|nr:hypothetical protein [Acinetobacter bereziniae]